MKCSLADLLNCKYKDHFASLREASRRAKRIRKQGDGHRIMPYKCPVCDGWMLGHTHAEGAILKEPKYDSDALHTV